jgi:RNA polymerase sigma-70 factor (ECF subfamily)
MQDLMLLVGPLIPGLRRYARSLLRDRSAADDLVQDCLERVIARWQQRRPDDSVRAWVFTILHNLAISRFRQNARRNSFVAIEDAGEAATASAPTQEQGLKRRELLRLIETLPEEQRAVLLLVSVEDLSYAETARALDIPIGTVMSRLARARERLWRQMDGEAPAVAPRPALRRVK